MGRQNQILPFSLDCLKEVFKVTYYFATGVLELKTASVPQQCIDMNQAVPRLQRESSETQDRTVFFDYSSTGLTVAFLELICDCQFVAEESEGDNIVYTRRT